MAKGTWTIQVKSGGAWGANTTIHRPNDNFVTRKTSTQTKLQLADGNNAFMTPSGAKYNDDPIVFIWYEDTGTVKTQVEGYIESQNDLKITDDNSTIYYGRFTNIEVIRKVGFDTNYYDIQATFEVIPTLA
jgi:hypothetical protein